MGQPGQLLLVCSKCGRSRTQIEHFYNYGGKRSKRQRSVCKHCLSVSSKALAARTKDRINELAQARRRNSPRAMAASLYFGAKRRAAIRGIEFTIDLEFVNGLISLGCCAVTGIRFEFSRTGTRQNPRAPSLDRINPRVGYVKSNCRLVTWIYNRAKGDGTDQDVIELAEALNAVSVRQAG
jgi:hypothetical protein